MTTLRPTFAAAYVGLLGAIAFAQGSTLLTFDDLPTGTGYISITNGYGGLQWINFDVINGSTQNTNTPYYNGRISTPNVAFNPYGDPASFSYASRLNLDSAYLTGQNGSQVRVKGFAQGNLLYDNTYTLNSTNPTFVQFNYLQVDNITFATGGSTFVLDNLTITSTNPPTASFVASPVVGQALTIQFIDQSIGAVSSWDWDFGDGSPHSSIQSPSHTYSSDGTFVVSLKVTGSNRASNTKTTTITVDPFAAFVFSPGWGSAPLSVQFSDRSKGSITDWDWDFGDSSSHSSVQNPSHTFTNPGTYIVTLTVTNSRADSSSKLGFITATSISNGATLLTFDDLPTGTGYISITNGYGGLQWINFDVINGTTQNTNSGYFNGRVTTPNVAFNPYGNPASFTYGGPFDLNSAYVTANDDGVQLRAQGLAGTSLLYDRTFLINKSAPSFIQFNFLQVDKVTFATVPSGGIFAIDNLATTTTAHFSASPPSGQAPLSVQFMDESIGSITNWDWNFGDGSPHSSSENPSHSYNLVGSFNVVLTVTGTNGLRYSWSGEIASTAPTPACTTPSPQPLLPHMVQASGCNYYGQANTGCFTNVTAIAAGQSHSLLLTQDGGLVALGSYYDDPVVVPSGLSNVIAVSAGNYHSLTLKSDGTVVAWGHNDYGQIALPAGLTNVVAVSAGSYHSLLLKADGTIVGLGTTVPDGLTNIVAVSAGNRISLALKADGTVVGWNLGNGADPSGLSNIVAISAADDCCYEAWEALRSDGVILGGNAFGPSYWGPVGSGVVEISASRGTDSHISWALTYDGMVFASGGGFAFCGGPWVPSGLSNVVAIASGDAHNLALIGNAPPVVHALLSSLTSDSNGFAASLATQYHHVYRLEYKSDLANPNWIGLPLVAGNGKLRTLNDPTPTAGGNRFYRVRRW